MATSSEGSRGEVAAAAVDPPRRSLPWPFWLAFAVVTLFALWCGWLMRTVAFERGQVELRVGWLSAAQEIQQALRGGGAVDRSASLRELAKQVEEAAGPEARAALAAAVAGAAGGEARLAGLDAFVRATRGETAVLSQQLAQRLNALYVLTIAGLVFAATALGLLALAVRRQRRADFFQASLLRSLEELERARAAADRANVNKTAFVLHVSHELRTPMNAVLGYTQLAQETLARRGDPEIVADLGRVAAASAHALELIGAFLDLSRMEAGRLDLKRAPCDLAALVAGTLDLVRGQAVAKGLELRVDVDPDVPPRIVGDAARIRQVLLNLVANAVRFTDVGAVSTRVSIVGGQVRFEVEDTGPGIPRAAQARLFQPFSQVGDEDRGGTGLGLALSKQLVEAMSGRIGVESEAGRGARFWFELSVELPAATPTAAA